MENETMRLYIYERYKYSVSWYHKAANLNKYSYNICQGLLIILSALAPVSILIQDTICLSTECLSVVITVSVAILASSLKVFRFQEKWILFRSTCEALKSEYFQYMGNAGDYTDSNKNDKLFVDRIEAIMSQENGKWLNIIPEVKQ